MLKFVLMTYLCLVTFDFGQSKLILVHSIFRHGERTSDTRFMYPTDPYKNETFLPYGNGQLTNVGKRTMYDLGKALRQRYNDFLGDGFLPVMVDGWASSLVRTQNALLLVLAGLFPPKDLLIWNKDLMWQPIVYNSYPKESDTLLLSLLQPQYVEMYKKHCQSDQAKNAMDRAEPVLAYIRKHSGLRAYIPREFFFLYITLITEDDYGLELPQWTKAIYPEPLTDLVHLDFELQMGNKELRRYLLGHLMQKILVDTDNLIRGNSERKIHLYSAHDVNIVYVLMLFGQMYKHLPGYSACVTLEIHEEDNKYFLQVQYMSEKNSVFKLLPFPNGDTRMYLEDFRLLIAELLQEESHKRFRNTASKKFAEFPIVYEMIVMYIFFKHLG